MKREMSVEWETEFNECRVDNTQCVELSTKITLECDDDNDLWLTFHTGMGTEFKRVISPDYIVKLSRFFYDAADFIKRDS